MKNPLHRKKLQLSMKNISSKQPEKSAELDYVWVTRTKSHADLNLSCLFSLHLNDSEGILLFQVGSTTSAFLSTKTSLMMGGWMDRCCSTSLW